MTNANDTTRDMSLDDALESVAVAVGLGMDVPAVQGISIYEGSLIPNLYAFTRGTEYSTPACNSPEAVRAYLTNEALRQLFSECAENDQFLHRFLFRADKEYDTFADYLAVATDVEILVDYARYCNADVDTWMTVIVGDIPERVSMESLNDGFMFETEKSPILEAPPRDRLNVMN